MCTVSKSLPIAVAGETLACPQLLALRADFRCSEAPMSREAVHASYRSYYSQHSTVLPHYSGSARSDAGLDGTQDSDRPISQGRRRIVAVSQPEHPRDLV